MKKGKKMWSPDGYLFAQFRRIWRWSRKRKEIKGEKNCAVCKREFEKDEIIYADHINPVIDPAKGFQGWDMYYDRMFNGKLQALCGPCHSEKTKAENKLRRKKAK